MTDYSYTLVLLKCRETGGTVSGILLHAEGRTFTAKQISDIVTSYIHCEVLDHVEGIKPIIYGYCEKRFGSSRAFSYGTGYNGFGFAWINSRVSFRREPGDITFTTTDVEGVGPVCLLDDQDLGQGLLAADQGNTVFMGPKRRHSRKAPVGCPVHVLQNESGRWTPVSFKGCLGQNEKFRGEGPMAMVDCRVWCYQIAAGSCYDTPGNDPKGMDVSCDYIKSLGKENLSEYCLVGRAYTQTGTEKRKLTLIGDKDPIEKSVCYYIAVEAAEEEMKDIFMERSGSTPPTMFFQKEIVGNVNSSCIPHDFRPKRYYLKTDDPEESHQIKMYPMLYIRCIDELNTPTWDLELDTLHYVQKDLEDQISLQCPSYTIEDLHDRVEEAMETGGKVTLEIPGREKETVLSSNVDMSNLKKKRKL